MKYLFVGGPLHGTAREVPDESDTVMYSKDGEIEAQPYMYTYMLVRYWREINGEQRVRAVYMDAVTSRAHGMDAVNDAAAKLWFSREEGT